MAKSKHAGFIAIVITFVIIVSGLYAIIYAAPRIEGLGIETSVIQYEKVPIADEVTALFVREETLYTAQYTGSTNYLIEAGTKVRAGTQVMYIETGTAADEEFGLVDADESNENALSLETIMNAGGSGMAVSEGGVTPTTAIVNYYADGWEKKVTPENLLSLPKSVFAEAPGEAANIAREWVRAGEPVYRITNNNLWRVAFWIENADKTILDKYKIGHKVTLELDTTRVTATVETAEVRDKDIFVVLSSDMYYGELDKYRIKEISVIFSEVSGAVIEKQSVKLKSGQTGVYVKQQSGTFKWVPVKVLKESGNRYVIAETSYLDSDGTAVSTIKYYDEIMTNPSDEGY